LCGGREGIAEEFVRPFKCKGEECGAIVCGVDGEEELEFPLVEDGMWDGF
jgi:hypothetical protein